MFKVGFPLRPDGFYRIRIVGPDHNRLKAQRNTSNLFD
jgi:hypothetical protein